MSDVPAKTTVACPECGAALRMSTAMLGRTVTCPRCRAPVATSAPPAEREPAAPAPVPLRPRDPKASADPDEESGLSATAILFYIIVGIVLLGTVALNAHTLARIFREP